MHCSADVVFLLSIWESLLICGTLQPGAFLLCTHTHFFLLVSKLVINLKFSSDTEFGTRLNGHLVSESARVARVRSMVVIDGPVKGEKVRSVRRREECPSVREEQARRETSKQKIRTLFCAIFCYR